MFGFSSTFDVLHSGGTYPMSFTELFMRLFQLEDHGDLQANAYGTQITALL